MRHKTQTPQVVPTVRSPGQISLLCCIIQFHDKLKYLAGGGISYLPVLVLEMVCLIFAELPSDKSSDCECAAHTYCVVE
ncbi:hypothetical protein DM02DRAFT_314430 [Periconia macrospinosa]|uniref:Uncharacterized protein n=1 Tax=Periconia macrospinosa TaxID=97972 RepID=A0A2V1D3P0_9PLEO|nr:hypothetical protein DM02DRAFT_314430 [Periconia macrospinosa]